ncbi:hypothetical protein DCE93_06535 [Agromyces badenianii]|uniref:Uncharacterized protein n=1 Tax=Agromyces badenianii TaxID=2080742 RepID=A0A2S0WVH8_9MICO|nr:hypothetical protein [Agromyces badenianii]AWB95355.1 hypothetical protein DCE93_06535 [Agromyces badenianii]
MVDARLLAPAAVAWAVAWCAIGLPDAGHGAATLAWSLWAAAGVAGSIAIGGEPSDVRGWL